MSLVLVTEQHLIDTADSIRAKLGVQTTYKPREFAAAIDSISTGGGITRETIISEQTITCSISLGDGAYGGFIQNQTEYPANGVYYIVTFDGVEYIARGHYRSSSILIVGDYYITAGATYTEYSFAIILQGGTLFYLAVSGSGTHTLKVDKILSW